MNSSRNIISQVYKKNYQSVHFVFKSSLYTIPLVWLAFDYLSEEPTILINFYKNCFVIFLSFLCFLAFKKEQFRDHYIKFYSFYFFFTSIHFSLLTVSSSNMLGYLLGLSSGGLMFSLSAVCRVWYILPMILVSNIISFLFKDQIITNPTVDFYGFIFFLNIVYLCSVIVTYFKFKAAISAEIKTQLIKKQKDEIDKQNTINRNLLRVLSHDILNELQLHSLICTKLQRIASNYPDDDLLSKYIEKYRKSSTNIASIVNTLKDWEAVRSGKVKKEIQSICINEVIEKNGDLFEEKLSLKDIKLIHEGDLNLRFNCNLDIFSNHIYNNLLSNAIKFSYPNSKITLSCKKYENIIMIDFIDRGIGIPEELIKDIFDPNEVTSRLGTESESGTGFGLPLVKEYTEFFEGTIDVQSSHSDGKSKTIFTLTFPL